MKIKRTIALGLVLAFLLSCTALFFACSANGKIVESAKTLRVDLSEYSLIYGETANGKNVSNSFRALVDEFANRLQYATGVTMRAERSSRTQGNSDAAEILVGQTNREESQKALSAIKGHGFSISVSENKIIIIGSNPLLTLYALNWFSEHYLTQQSSDGVLEISKKVSANHLSMMTVATQDSFDFQVIHDKNADTDPGFEDPAAISSEKYDIAYSFAVQARQKLLKLTKTKEGDHPLGTDAAAASGAEIMIGRVDRAACHNVLSTMREDQYGVCVEQGNVVITAWSDAGLPLATSLFKDLLDDAEVVEDGSYVYLFPADMRIIATVDPTWKTDFPKPQDTSIALYNTMDCGDGALQYLYQGAGVDESAFDTYISTLLEDGYILYADTDVNKVEGSCFATLINQDTDTVLYVAYNAFAHADELTPSYASISDGERYEIAFDDSDDSYAKPSLRIVSYSRANAHLGEEALYHIQRATKKVTDAALVSIALPKISVGTGYVMMLEDGTFLVFDGGDGGADTLYNVLSSLHLQVFGEISEEHPIHIRAWINSHNHTDHVNAFYALALSYGRASGSTPAIRLDYIIGTYPSASASFNTTESSSWSYKQFMSTIASRFESPVSFIEVHTGQKLYFPNVELEILFTHEDLNPHNIVTGNDASTLIRVTMQPTADGITPSGKTTSFMWTGDMYRYGGQWACATFGSYLKSDMVSVTHHGGPGADEQFFDFVTAQTVWWPMVAENIMGTGTAQQPAYGYLTESGWYTKVDQAAVYSDYAHYLFTATDYCIALFIGEDGAKHNEIKRVGNGVHHIDIPTEHDGRNFWYKAFPIASK